MRPDCRPIPQYIGRLKEKRRRQNAIMPPDQTTRKTAMQPDFSRPVLAVDTGTSFLSLALQTDGRILSCHTDAGNKQSDLILPQIGGLFAEAGITAADLGADAVIVADPAVMAYACEKHPNLRLHMSVQGSATNYEAINLMKDLFGIRRAVLPRVLTIDQVQHVIENTDVEIEVFGFGSLCVMVEGRCILSSYATGESPNMQGVCSPAKAVRWEQLPDKMNVRLNQVMIDQFNKDEPAGYPTLCKGRFEVNDETYYALEEPTSLNVLEVLPQLIKIGVAAVKVEGRQRSPMYTAQVTRTLRQALDAAAADPAHYRVTPAWDAALGKVSEGSQSTLGAYNRPWK